MINEQVIDAYIAGAVTAIIVMVGLFIQVRKPWR